MIWIKLIKPTTLQGKGATVNPVPAPVDPVTFVQIRFRSGSGQILTGSTRFGLVQEKMFF